MANSSQQSSGNVSALSVIILPAALALSILLLRWQGDSLIVRALVGTAWGLYCLYAFGIARLVERLSAERDRDARSPRIP